jgi:hypothetical protein
MLGHFLHKTSGCDPTPTQRVLQNFGIQAFSLHHSPTLPNSKLMKFRNDGWGIDGTFSLSKSTTHQKFRQRGFDKFQNTSPRIFRSAKSLDCTILCHVSTEHRRFWFTSGLCTLGVPEAPMSKMIWIYARTQKNTQITMNKNIYRK